MMIKDRQKMLSIILVILFGAVLFYIGTDGFQAYTAEAARTNQLIDEQPIFPDVTLEDSEERVYPMSTFAGKYVMLTFIYTSCTDVCLQLEMNLAQVYERVPSEFIGKDIVFLSISFDPTRDDPETLEKYRHYFNSDGETWRMARINNQKELDHLLDEFGVIVIPDDTGDFTHNAAFYLVDPTGKLVDVMDYTKIDEAAASVTSTLKKEVRDK